MIVDNRLRERELGNPETLNEAFWKRQYEDHNYKNVGGESLNDAQKRMTSAINEILSTMQDGDIVAIVSHATAICAYLLNWCSIEVVDEQKKLRKITHKGAVVMNGKMSTPSAFILEFEKEKLCKVKYIETWTTLLAARSLGNNMMDEKGKILLLAFELGVRILSEDSK